MCSAFPDRDLHLSPAYQALCARAVGAYTPGPTDSPVTSGKFRSLLASMVAWSRAFVAEPEQVSILSAGMRSVVVLVAGAEDSVVVKHFRRRDSASNSGGFGYLREKHGLIALNQLVPGSYSALLGFDDRARCLALEQVPGPPLSQVLARLLGQNQPASKNGAGPRTACPPDEELGQLLDAWVDFYSALLTSPYQAQAQATFRQALAQADPQAPSPGSLTSPNLALKGLKTLMPGLAPDSPEWTAHHQQLESILYPAPQHSILSPGDFSPANLVLAQTQPKGIDAEGTAIHHWALPLAELILGFPSYPGPPLPPQALTSAPWARAAHRLYRTICPYQPHPSPAQDPQVQAALLTIRAILAEQKN